MTWVDEEKEAAWQSFFREPRPAWAHSLRTLTARQNTPVPLPKGTPDSMERCVDP